MILQKFADAAEAGQALAAEVTATLRLALGWREAASLAVPGGRTPVPFFRSVRDAELDWSRVSITLTDERWVPEVHASSNAAMVRGELLAGRAGAARFVPLFEAGGSASQAAQAVWQRVRLMPRPFDAVVLGMGEDGHFASLFAGNNALPVALDPRSPAACVAMQAPVAPTERMSLNLAALLQTRRLFLQVTGSPKLDLLLAAAQPGQATQWPVGALLAQRHPEPEVFWSP
jgi:6-phosphogluconolactonase